VRHYQCEENIFFYFYYIFSYANHLRDAKKLGIKKGFVTGLGFGINFVILFGILGLAYW